MADFCWDCLARDIYPEHPERNDLRGLCAPGGVAYALCEGCGAGAFDATGRRVADEAEPA
jgi:hypothetical protein